LVVPRRRRNGDQRDKRLIRVIELSVLWDEGADDERDAEGDKDSFDEEDGVVTPTQEGEGDDDAPHVDFAEKGGEPLGLCGGGGDSGSDATKKARDFGAVREVGFAEFSGEEGFFCRDKAELKEENRENAEDRSAGRHEERECEGVDEGAEVERIAQMTIGTGRDNAFAVHGGVLNDGGA
jgi:hypothetical protein